MATPERGPRTSSTEERFEAAVKVIRSLPSEGSFQPTNIAKLRFYALYKQAKEGPCNIPKPAFWNAVGRAKWEAWKTCGMMKKEIAMQLYVDELKQMVEMMPQSREVEDFLRAYGPMFEFVEDEEEAAKSKPSEASSTATPPTKPPKTDTEAVKHSDSKPLLTPDTSTTEQKQDGPDDTDPQQSSGNGSHNQLATSVSENSPSEASSTATPPTKPPKTDTEAVKHSDSKPLLTPDTSTTEQKQDGPDDTDPQQSSGNGSHNQLATSVSENSVNQIHSEAQHDPISSAAASAAIGKKIDDATGDSEPTVGDQEGVESGAESDKSEDFQESFQDLPERGRMQASSSNGDFFSPMLSQSQSLTEEQRPLLSKTTPGYSFETTPARSPKPGFSYHPPRLLVSTERGLGGISSSRLTIPMFGHAQQPVLEVQRGGGVLQRSPRQAAREEEGRDAQRDRMRTSLTGGEKWDPEQSGEEAEYQPAGGVLPVDPSQHLPQTLEVVTSQLQQLQLQLQTILGQMNTTALAVHGIVQLYHQHTGTPQSQETADLTSHSRRVPSGFHGNRRWLRLCLRLGPVLVVWPLIVNLIMSYLYRRFGAGPAGFPSWMWGVFTLLQVAFSLLYSFLGRVRFW